MSVANNFKGRKVIVENGFLCAGQYERVSAGGSNLDLSTAANNGLYAPELGIDPAGGAIDVILEPEADCAGLKRTIYNRADASETITVKNDAGSSLGTIEQNRAAILYCDGTSWTFEAKWTISLS